MQCKTPRFEQKLVFRGACPARSTLHHHHISKTSSVWVMRQLCAIYFISLLFSVVVSVVPRYMFIYIWPGVRHWNEQKEIGFYRIIKACKFTLFSFSFICQITEPLIHTFFSLSAVSFGLGLQSSSSSPGSVMLYIIKFFVSAFLSMQIDCIVSTLAHVSTFTISHTLSSDLGAMQRSSGLSISDLRVSFFSLCLSSLLHFFAPCE